LKSIFRFSLEKQGKFFFHFLKKKMKILRKFFKIKS
jgi:hypothetical protein